MQVVQLKCPSCGHGLEVEDGIDTFFCQYCGHRIVLAEQSEHIIRAKVDIEKMKHEERLYQMKLEAEEKERKEKDKSSNIIIAICFGTLLLILLVSVIMALLGVDP